MKPTTVKSIYAIRCKATGEYVKANGKSCWMSKAGAQSSWNNCWEGERVGAWKVQTEYEVVDGLDEQAYTMSGLIDSLLKKVALLVYKVAQLQGAKNEA